jgi:hypothetical protein
MDNVFPNAVEARAGARNNSLIYAEIRAIETAVLTAIDDGDLSTTVNGTAMTANDETGQEYCSVWQAATTDRSKFEQMMIVEKYFRDMGYTIRRKLPSSDSLVFVWEVLW